MDTRLQSASAPSALPALRVDAAGRTHVDLRAVLALALPLVANSAVQTVLNLTDLWFIGHISTTAVAAVGAVTWLALMVVLVLSGVGMAVQTVAAQAYGGRRLARAAQAVWTSLWGALLAAPLFVLAGLAGRPLFAHFDLDPEVGRLATAFWAPRVGGAFLGAALWGVLGFFNGIGRPRITMTVTLCAAIANALLNALFIFGLGWGVAGSAWASTCAQAIGLAAGLAVFLHGDYRTRYRSHLTLRPRQRALREQLRLGLPMGLTYASDLLAMSLFLIMQVRLSTVDGAATQVVFVVTSLAYMPGIGVALAGTTLVGQSIGAGDPVWAMRVGNHVILYAALVMGGIGLLLALSGPWTLPLVLSAADPSALAVIARASTLLWFAAAYQLFDGLNVGSALCLRGAGDARVPALLVALAALIFVPLAHSLMFAPGAGWTRVLPQLGWGSLGGWSAVVFYILMLGASLYARWHSGVWQRIRL